MLPYAAIMIYVVVPSLAVDDLDIHDVLKYVLFSNSFPWAFGWIFMLYYVIYIILYYIIL